MAGLDICKTWSVSELTESENNSLRYWASAAFSYLSSVDFLSMYTLSLTIVPEVIRGENQSSFPKRIKGSYLDAFGGDRSMKAVAAQEYWNVASENCCSSSGPKSAEIARILLNTSLLRALR